MKKCASCKTPADQWKYPPRNSAQKACSMACALDLVEGKKQKAADKRRKQRKAEFLKNDTPTQKRLAQKAFNAYIRERDKHLGCVSCDKPHDWQGQFHAGHFYTVAARPDLRFNEDNVMRQCSVCNNHLSGNLLAYKETLIQRIGLARFADLEQQGKPERHGAEYYREIAATYRAKLKALQSE